MATHPLDVGATRGQGPRGGPVPKARAPRARWTVPLALLLASCLPPAPPLDEAAPRDAAPADPLVAEIKGLVGGHARLAWFRHKGAGADPQEWRGWVHDEAYELVCFDTRDGAERVLVESAHGFNNTVPRMTHDGSRVVYSDIAEDAVKVVDWLGGPPRTVARGQLAYVWHDPDRDTEWVYVFKRRHGPNAPRDPVMRYDLDDTSRRETVWDKWATDLFTLSADGKRVGGSFPWPRAGVADLEKGTWERYAEGCWPCISPDTSYRFMVFLGNHRASIVFDEGGANRRRVAMNDADGVTGREVYWPQWANHPRFVTMGGPFEGGRESDVYLGRFDPGFTRIEGWVRLGAGNDRCDLAPIAWIDPAPAACPRVTAFSADVDPAIRGRPVSVRWQTAGADRVRIDPLVGEVAASGSKDLRLEGSTRFTLTASGPGGPAIVRLDVRVLESRPAERPAGVAPGLRARYFRIGELEALPDFGAMRPYAESSVPEVRFPVTDGDFASSGRADNVAAVFDGFLEVPRDGVYCLGTRSDDGSRLFVGDALVAGNDGLHAMTDASGEIALDAGRHAIRIEFFEAAKDAGLVAFYSGPGISERPLPADALFHVPPARGTRPWPASREGLLFLWETADRPVVAFDASGTPLYAYSMTARGRARLDRNHAMVLSGGACEAEDMSAHLLREVRRARALTLEMTLTPSRACPDEPGRVAGFLSEDKAGNFALDQVGTALRLRLRGAGGARRAAASLCRVPVGEPSHVVVTCDPGGSVVCYLNGEPAQSVACGPVGFEDWRVGRLIFGSALGSKRDWAGRLEGVAFYSRCMPPEEVARNRRLYSEKMRARRPVAPLVVEGVLAARSETPDPEAMAPYRRALVVHEYRVEKVVEGECPARTIRVAHWGVLDLEVQPIAAASPGDRRTLLLEPFGGNPQLEPEYLADTLPPDDDAPLYYDIGE